MIRRIGLLALFAIPLTLFAQVNSDDLTWQKAVSKYDAQRGSVLRQVEQVSKEGPFQPTWDSLKQYKIPDWYQDAKFGIFIHWGVYSVPAFGSEWYPRLMYMQGSPEFKHHIETYGPQTKFGYKDFIPQFKAERFDAKQWADLFREAGAKYVVPVAEHHDGFPMYASDLTDYSAAKMGPKRDVIGELAKAIRADGLHFGASSHRAEHYFFLNGGREFPSDVQDPQYAAFYGPAHAGIKGPEWTGHPDEAYIKDWLARTAEIVEKYQPELLYFDWWIERKEFAPYLQEFAAFYYNEAAKQGSSAIINYKNEAFPQGTAVLDVERGQLDQTRDLHWQTDTSVSNKSWGYIEHDTFKTPESIIQELVDVVSKNGNLLLNIGPKSDGTIPEEVQSVLRQVGKWLNVNGEAIYGTRPWKIYGEGPTKVVAGAFHDTEMNYTAQDIRFTRKGDTVYAIALGWPRDGHLTVKSLDAASGVKIGKVELLGSPANVQWSQAAEGLELSLPRAPEGMYAYAFRITPTAH